MFLPRFIDVNLTQSYCLLRYRYGYQNNMMSSHFIFFANTLSFWCSTHAGCQHCVFYYFSFHYNKHHWIEDCGRIACNNVIIENRMPFNLDSPRNATIDFLQGCIGVTHVTKGDKARSISNRNVILLFSKPLYQSILMVNLLLIRDSRHRPTNWLLAVLVYVYIIVQLSH